MRQPSSVLRRLGFDPRHLDRSLVKLASILVVVGCAVVIATFSFGRDQSIYATIGHGIVEGKVPYRDLWDFKPPGIFFLFALAEVLFGHSMAAPRLLEASALVACGFGMAALGRRWFDSDIAGWLGAAIGAVAQLELDFWHTGQPETFGGMLTIGALYFATAPRGKIHPFVYWSGAGFLLGCAGLLKPPLGGVILVIAAYLSREQLIAGARRAWWKPAVVVFTGAAIPVVTCALWFYLRGAWGAVLWTFRDFVPGYTRLGWYADARPLEMAYFATIEAVTAFSPLIAVGAVVAVVGQPLASREREGRYLLLGCAAVHVVGVALQAKFFQYHYAATIPILSLLAGVGWMKIGRWLRARSVPVAPVTLVSVPLLLLMQKPVRDVPGTVPERTAIRLSYLLGRSPFDSRPKMDQALHRAADFDLGADRSVADWVSAHTRRTDHIFVWGFEPAIYWLSGRSSASRFVYDVPQRCEWRQAEARQLLMRDLGANLPAVIVVQHNDVFPAVTGSQNDSAADLRDFPGLANLLAEDYGYRKSIQDFDLYQLKP